MLPEEFIGGLFSFFYVITSTIVGISVMSRYLKYKEKSFIFVGLAIGGIACPWWPSAVSFLALSIFHFAIPDQLYLFLGITFAPIITFSWIIGLNILLYDGKNKLLLIIYGIIFSLMDIVFLIVLSLFPDLVPLLIGIIQPNHLDVEYKGFIMLMFIIIVATVLITGDMVSWKSIKSKNHLVKIKGQILFTSFTVWAVAAVLDAVAPLNIFGVVIVRTILIIQAFGFYIGWIMPKFAQSFFIKIRLLKPE